MNNLATKIVTILVTSCIMPHGAHLNLPHMALIYLMWQIGLDIGHVTFTLKHMPHNT